MIRKIRHASTGQKWKQRKADQSAVLFSRPTRNQTLMLIRYMLAVSLKVRRNDPPVTAIIGPMHDYEFPGRRRGIARP